MYKLCNNLLPSTFNNMFAANANNHKYNTRHASDFPTPNLNLVVNLSVTKALRSGKIFQSMATIQKVATLSSIAIKKF